MTQALRVELNRHVSPTERVERERQIEAVRALLDETAFAEAWAEGQAMTLEQAIAYAIEGSAPT